MQAQGTLLSAIVPNPRNHENVNVVTTIAKKENIPNPEIIFPYPPRLKKGSELKISTSFTAGTREHFEHHNHKLIRSY